MFGGLGWSSRNTGARSGSGAHHHHHHHDDEAEAEAGSSSRSRSRSSCSGSPSPAAAPQTPPPRSASAPLPPLSPSLLGHDHGHSRDSSLDEASMLSDLTSTSYQHQHQHQHQHQPPQPQPQPQPPQRDSPAVSELTEASALRIRNHGGGLRNHGGGGSSRNNANGDRGSPSSTGGMMPALPSIGLAVGGGSVGNAGDGIGTSSSSIRRPARIASRLESIPSVGYVNSHEEPDGDDGGDNDGDNDGGEYGRPYQDGSGSHMDKFAHHLQRYNDHVDKKQQQHHHHQQQQQQHVHTDVTDTSTVDESYSESEWSASRGGSSSALALASTLPLTLTSRSVSSNGSSSLEGLPHAHAQAHAQALHTITSFNTSATDGDVDTDVDIDLDNDEDSLLYTYHPQRQNQNQNQNQNRHPSSSQPHGRPISPVLPAGSMTNRPPSRRSRALSPSSISTSTASSSSAAHGQHYHQRALSPPTPRSVTTTTSSTPIARSSPSSRRYHSHSHPHSHSHSQPNRPLSRAGSISRPRYAVEFRHRSTAASGNGSAAGAEQQQLHQPHRQLYPSPVATEAAARAQAVAVAVYDRDGRHVERVVMDVDDPYLSHGSSAEDFDMDLEEQGGSNDGAANRYSRPEHKLRRSDVGFVALPTPPVVVEAHTPALHYQRSGGIGHGHGGKLASNLFGSLFRTIRTILLLGAVGATVTLLRAHFLLAAGGAAAASGGAAASIFGSSATAAALASQGLVAGGGIAAVRLANGALALPKVTDLLLTAAVREAARAERAVLREKAQRVARMLPDGRPISIPGSGAAAASGGGRRLSTRDGVASASGETYAVRLSTTPGRSDLTDAAVDRLAQCPSIADVRLVHSGGSKDDGSDLLGGWGDEGSIIKRPGLSTDAVLLLVDDLAFTCEDLDRAFDVWSKDPDRMVGFYTYDLVPNGGRSASFGLGEISRGKGRYSIVSDRAAFVHRSYLTSISAKAAINAASEWSSTRASGLASECDSYSLSLAVSAVSSKAPISVAAEPLELRLASSSSNANSVSSSSAECLLGIASALGMQVLPSEERIYVGSN